MLQSRNHTILWMIPLLIVLGISCPLAHGKIIYVDEDATGANDGTTWADAYHCLHDGLAAAVSGDEIRVAQGTYRPDQGVGVTSGNPYATFQLKNGVALMGGYAGFGEPDPDARDVDLYETILSGDLNENDIDLPGAKEIEDVLLHPTRADNAYHVVTGSAVDASTVMDGLTVMGGNAVSEYAGGLINDSASPTVVDCTFRDNAGWWGGVSSEHASSPTFTDCVFVNNAGSAGGGGGMVNSGSSPVLNSCTFQSNKALGLTSGGGAMTNADSTVTLTGCVFADNSASLRGGAIFGWGSTYNLDNCTFNENLSGRTGGAILVYEGEDWQLTNCAFNRNSAQYAGGAIWISGWGGKHVLTNCTFTGNSAGDRGGALHIGGASSPILDRCDFIGNSVDNDGSLGGAIHEGPNCSPRLTGCTFENNLAKGVNSCGGAISTGDSSNPAISACTFCENQATGGEGGAIYSVAGSPVLANCVFRSNSADSGAGVRNKQGPATLANCLFIGNSAASHGGGLATDGGQCTVTNCTFNGNSAGIHGGGIRSSDATLANCILWGDTPDEVDVAGSTVITYSDVEGGSLDIGNIDADPCFVAPGHWDPNGTPDDPNDDTWVDGDYHLLPNSPCIDAGDPNLVADPNKPESDFYGGPRFAGARIDMGADEYSKHDGSTGEPNEPYQIWSPEAMHQIGMHHEDLDWRKHFKLMGDLELLTPAHAASFLLTLSY